MSDNKLELKITTDSNGKEIDLTNLSLVAAKALNVLLGSIINIIEATPNTEQTRIKVIKGSATISIDGTDGNLTVLENDLKDVLDNKSIKKEIVLNWRNIQNIIYANGLNYEINFLKNKQSSGYAELIKKGKTFKAKAVRKEKDYELVFLKGELVEGGGKKPNLHLSVGKEEKIINCSNKDVAKVIIQKFLYSNLCISTWAKKAEATKTKFDLCDFYPSIDVFEDFEKFVNSNTKLDESDEYVEIHKKIRNYLENNQFGKLKKFMRLYNHQSSDFGSLKTILLITKSFKTQPEIIEIREQLRILLDNKLSKPN